MPDKAQISQMQDLEADALMDKIISRVANRVRTKTVSGNQGNYLHGPNSFLGVLGMEQPIENAMVMPLAGIADPNVVPYMRSNYEDEIFPILTGQTASSGEEPAENCADSPVAGSLKICKQIFPFGRIQLDSTTIDITNVGRLINQGEFVNPTLIGNPWQNIEPPSPLPYQQALQNEVGKRMVELIGDISRRYGHLAFDGNPGNTSTHTGGYLEYFGLSKLVNTGYLDATTQQPCPAADSLVVNFGSALMDTNARTYVQQISEAVRIKDYLAKRTGQYPVRWALVMRYSTFMKLTEVWPCAYFTVQCTNLNTGSTQFVEAQRQIELRNEMRAGQYLITVYDQKIPVIIDDFVDEEVVPNAGNFCSEFYLVPITTAGGNRSLFWQYFNWDTPGGAMEAAAYLTPAGTVSTFGGGQYLIVRKMPKNTCTQLQAITKKRLILRTPFLAVRFTNACYTITQKERGFTGMRPGDQYGYNPDGGNLYNPAPTFYPQKFS
jgi:hypothetical protein